MTLAEFLLARIAEDEARIRHVLVEPERKWGRFAASSLLLDCEAKRRLVEKFGYRYPDGSVADDVLPILALAYADHPDFREEWKP